MNPGDLVFAVHDECSLTPEIDIIEGGHFTWGRHYRMYKDIRVTESTICCAIAVIDAVFSNSIQSDSIVYLLAPHAIGWDYAGFYERVS